MLTRHRALTAVLLASLVATVPATAIAAPAAPRPTSTAVSPGAPDPHPPAGGTAPDGSVAGGARLASRGVIRPTGGAPVLPQGIGAKAWVLADLDTGKILAARDPHGRYQPASVLKMLTTITVLPHLPGKRLVRVTPAAAHAEGSAVGLLAGARYSVDQLFQALLLVSGNDAAEALAQANGGIGATVAQMNAEIVSLGGYDTYVQTPSGLDGWQQLTSAYDLMLVLRAAVRQPRILAYDKLRSATYDARRSTYGHVGGYEFDNQSNPFFDTVPGALLAKIGYTDAAQHTYMAAARRDGHTLGVVFLRDQRLPLDQYQQAARLFDWGFSLKPGVQPVGELAGPISAAHPSTSGSPTKAPATPSATRSQQVRLQAAAAQSSGRGWQWPAGIIACLLLVGAGAAGWRASRHRAPRRR